MSKSRDLDIYGAYITELKVIPDERGSIKHIFKRIGLYPDGEVYVSSVNPGRVKAWHIHSEMDLNYACVHGMIKLVLYDMREDSPTFQNLEELFVGDDNYCMVHIPSRVANGFKGISLFPSIVVNVASIIHSPEEITRIPAHAENVIPYNWEAKDG